MLVLMFSIDMIFAFSVALFHVLFCVLGMGGISRKCMYCVIWSVWSYFKDVSVVAPFVRLLSLIPVYMWSRRTHAVHLWLLLFQAIFDELCNVLDPGTPSFTPQKGKTSVIMFVGLQGAYRSPLTWVDVRESSYLGYGFFIVTSVHSLLVVTVCSEALCTVYALMGE